MITINAAPVENSIILDANDSVISITSSNGAGYYFRANITIDGQLFDEQGWSRKDAVTAEKNIKKLYNAYFTTAFNENFVNGITEQSHLIKPVSIEVMEYRLADDTVAQSITLPDFYLMYNTVSTAFSDTEKIRFLGIDAPIMMVSEAGKISIPFMVNAVSENIVVKTEDNFNTILHSASLSSVEGKRFLFTILICLQ
ncbi:hypothetical protein [Flavobacterium sp. 3HN19-14]|uniref:hypothetical protein n=1 Tax=Flavobacterium sp. 3HN19-14 TaxID=3448133 RepID=UPI003EE19497